MINLGMTVAFSLVGFAADPPAANPAGVPPIKIVKIDRKEPVLYDKDIEPIFVNKCAFCHSGNIKEGKLDMATHESLMKGGKKGPAIIPGKSDESLLYKLSAKVMRPAMPPKSEEPLNPEELALVKLWIDQGAKAPTAARVRPKIVLTPPPASVHPVRALAFSPDKSVLAVARGNTVLLNSQIHSILANIAHGHPLAKLQVLLNEPLSVATQRSLVDSGLKGSDGKLLAVAHLGLVESIAISPDGKMIATGSFQEVVLWDLKQGTLVRRVGGFADRVVALAFSPDGKLLATGGGAPTEDGEVKILDVASGKVVLDIKNPHSDTVFGLAFSADGKMLASCGADKFVKTWEIPSGKALKSFEGHTHHVLDVSWKADGKFLASAGADNVIKVWNFEAGEQARTLTGHTKQVSRVVFVGATPTIATCSGDQSVRVWNSENGGVQRTLTGFPDYLHALAVTPDGLLIAAAGEDGSVRVFSGANNNQPARVIPAPH